MIIRIKNVRLNIGLFFFFSKFETSQTPMSLRISVLFLGV